MFDDAKAEALAHAVTPEILRRFIKANGWRFAIRSRRGVEIYRRGRSASSELGILPSATGAVLIEQNLDLAQRIGEALKQDPVLTLERILFFSSDVMKFQLPGDPKLPGTVPVDDLVEFLTRFKALVRYSFRGLEDHARFFATGPGRNKTMDEVANAWRFGRSEIGSYVPTLIGPLDAVADEAGKRSEIPNQGPLYPEQGLGITPDEFLEPPPVRRVNEYMVAGLKEVAVAADANALDRILAVDQQPVPLSRNFCESAAALLETIQSSKVQMTVAWSPALKPTHQTSGGVERIVLRRRYAEALRQVAEKMPGYEPQQEVTKRQGWVTDLHRHPDPGQNVIQGKVTVEIQIDGNTRKVHLVLNRDEYAVACDANRDGRIVRFTGVLKHQKGTFTVEDVKDFRAVSDDE